MHYVDWSTVYARTNSSNPSILSGYFKPCGAYFIFHESRLILPNRAITVNCITTAIQHSNAL